MSYRFIDLFAGLGGFHHALRALGHECVFASELKEDLREIYKINFPNTPIEGDITKINARNGIPAHDILCAGFPCQPFSQAGRRLGFEDADRGNLFMYICDILYAHRPKFVFLENVSNLEKHDNGRTWETIKSKLEELGYGVKKAVLSPHQFGLSQHRKRIFIVGINRDYGSIDDFSFPDPKDYTRFKPDVRNMLDTEDTNIVPLKDETWEQLQVWDEFIRLCDLHHEPVPTFPIWAMEFGADYEFTDTAPAYQDIERLRGRKGKLGIIINGSTKEECLAQLPKYAVTDKDEVFPDWKIRYIQQNRNFYERNRAWLDAWIENIRDFENSHMKFEWNCGKDSDHDLFTKIIQFRPSGIRVKLPNCIPALNLVGTQIPIIPWVKLPESALGENVTRDHGRYLSIREGAILQGLKQLNFGNLSYSRTWEALGNAVNATLVKHIAKNLPEL